LDVLKTIVVGLSAITAFMALLFFSLRSELWRSRHSEQNVQRLFRQGLGEGIPPGTVFSVKKTYLPLGVLARVEQPRWYRTTAVFGLLIVKRATHWWVWVPGMMDVTPSGFVHRTQLTDEDLLDLEAANYVFRREIEVTWRFPPEEERPQEGLEVKSVLPQLEPRASRYDLLGGDLQ
jgi:hypothetical protein